MAMPPSAMATIAAAPAMILMSLLFMASGSGRGLAAR
jgi:hypothetical protein